jgi:hypothetical protein
MSVVERDGGQVHWSNDDAQRTAKLRKAFQMIGADQLLPR